MDQMFRGQKYTYCGVTPYIKADGTETLLLEWSSHCAECGASFKVLTTGRAGEPIREPSRRCAEHRKRGVRVSPRRKRRDLFAKPAVVGPDEADSGKF